MTDPHPDIPALLADTQRRADALRGLGYASLAEPIEALRDALRATHEARVRAEADNARLRGDIHLFERSNKRLLKAQETILQVDAVIREDLLRLSETVASDRIVAAARAIAASKRGVMADDPTIDAVYSSYIGQARASIGAFLLSVPQGEK